MLVVLTIALLPGAFVAAFQDALGAQVLSRVIAEDDYLVAMRNSDLGCRTLRARVAEVAFLGDSHSYAAWDFGVAQDLLRQRVGSCALGGLYMESVPEMLAAVLDFRKRPKWIVLGLSPRMFWDSPTRRAQLAQHTTALSELRSGSIPSWELVKRMRELAGVGARLERDKSSRGPRQQSLPPAVLRAKLDQSGAQLPTLKNWIERLQDTRIIAAATDAVPATCALIAGSDVKLTVVHIPESPYLESMYPPGMWAAYSEQLARFSACGAKVILKRAADYGLRDNDFVDRMLVDETGYDVWSAPGALIDGRIFDPDHMNPLGAARFTAAIAGSL